MVTHDAGSPPWEGLSPVTCGLNPLSLAPLSLLTPTGKGQLRLPGFYIRSISDLQSTLTFQAPDQMAGRRPLSLNQLGRSWAQKAYALFQPSGHTYTHRPSAHPFRRPSSRRDL